jgi:hypothetical protein
VNGRKVLCSSVIVIVEANFEKRSINQIQTPTLSIALDFDF